MQWPNWLAQLRMWFARWFGPPVIENEASYNPPMSGKAVCGATGRDECPRFTKCGECDVTRENTPCQKAPDGWRCIRTAGHMGSCAAVPVREGRDTYPRWIEDSKEDNPVSILADPLAQEIIADRMSRVTPTTNEVRLSEGLPEINTTNRAIMDAAPMPHEPAPSPPEAPDPHVPDSTPSISYDAPLSSGSDSSSSCDSGSSSCDSGGSCGGGD